MYDMLVLVGVVKAGEEVLHAVQAGPPFIIRFYDRPGHICRIRVKVLWKIREFRKGSVKTAN